MRIHIMNHAVDKIKERIGKSNWIDLAYEAFKSKEEIPIWFSESDKNLKKLGYSTYDYRFYLGAIWVFQKNPYDYKLLTVFKKKYEKEN